MLSPVEIDGFKRSKHNQYVDSLIEYFKEKDPFHAQAIGDQGMREVIQLGINNTAHYGLNQKSTVKVYIHTMLYLGSYFDTDPLLPWARQILIDKELGDQLNKTDALRNRLLDYLKAACGKKGEHLQNFMYACQKQLSDSQPQVSEAFIRYFIQTQYPQKYQLVGEAFLGKLIGNTHYICQSYGLYEKTSLLYLCCLRLVYGTKITEDPLFPWLAAVLNKEYDKHQKDKVFAKVVKQFFNQVIDYVEAK